MTKKTIKRNRDALDGRFISDAQAKRLPKGRVVRESVPKPGNGLGR